MRESKRILCALALLAVCATPVVAELIDPNSPLDPNSYTDVPLRFRNMDLGWSISVKNEDLDEVGIHVFGARNGSIIMEIDKWFNDADYNPLILSFKKTNATTTYNTFVIDDEYVVNRTNETWHGYIMSLSPGGIVGFDPNTIPSYGPFAQKEFRENTGYQGRPTTLDFFDGELSSVAPNNIFQPGYISGAIKIVADPSIPAGGEFILKELHTPEPISLLLLVVCGVFGWMKRR